MLFVGLHNLAQNYRLYMTDYNNNCILLYNSKIVIVVVAKQTELL